MVLEIFKALNLTIEIENFFPKGKLKEATHPIFSMGYSDNKYMKIMPSVSVIKKSVIPNHFIPYS